MARGDRNYFRHVINAHKDEKIQGLIEDLGMQGYAYYFILLEICASMCDSSDQTTFRLHPRLLVSGWRTHRHYIPTVLSVMSHWALIGYSVDTQWIVVDIPNIRKYLGLYSLNKRKENKRKENKINEIKINKEKEENTGKEKEKTAASDSLNGLPSEIFLLYNKLLSDSVGHAKILTEERKKKILKLLKTQLTTIDDWEKFFIKISKSDFLTGISSDWKASFDWILKPANVVKILEGNYDNNKNKKETLEDRLQKFFDSQGIERPEKLED